MFWQDLPSRLVTRQNSIQWLQELRSTAQNNPAVNSVNDHGCSLSCYHLSSACSTKRFWLPSELGCPIPYPELSYRELVAELCRKLGSRMYGLPHVQVRLSPTMEHKKIRRFEGRIIKQVPEVLFVSHLLTNQKYFSNKRVHFPIISDYELERLKTACIFRF